MNIIARSLLLITVLALIGGCKGGFSLPFFTSKDKKAEEQSQTAEGTDGEQADTEEVVIPLLAPNADSTKVQPLPYPAEAPVAADLDVQVVQQRDRLVLTNRTARSYQSVEIWVNQQYAAQLTALPVGGKANVLLNHLVNRHGETYPIPGLLTPDHFFPVHLVELYDTQQKRRFRLLVRR